MQYRGAGPDRQEPNDDPISASSDEGKATLRFYISRSRQRPLRGTRAPTEKTRRRLFPKQAPRLFKTTPMHPMTEALLPPPRRYPAAGTSTVTSRSWIFSVSPQSFGDATESSVRLSVVPSSETDCKT